MSLELVNTIAALTTAAVITATAIAALVQLRHMRASNQIAGFLTLRTVLDDDAHRRALALLRREGDVTREDGYREFVAAATSGRPTSNEVRYQDVYDAVGLVCNAFEVMGTLVRNGVVDRRMFLEQYCFTISGMWSRLEPYVVLQRKSTHDDGVWEDFEYMTVLSREFIKEHLSIYPAGVPRLLPSYAAKEPRVL